jgi:hypothetical protein
LIPEADLQLYAVATRQPQELRRGTTLQPTARPGVYDLPWGTATIRLIVLSQIEPHPRNAPWELFGTRQDQIRHGAAHYRPRRREAWALLRCLYLTHILEDPTMAYTMEEFAREARQRFLQELTPEELRAMLDQVPPEEVLKRFTPQERLRGLGPEELRQLEEYLKTLH